MAERRPSEHGSPAHVVTYGFTDLMTSLAVIFVLLMVVFANAARPPEGRAVPAPPMPPPVDLVETPEDTALEPPITHPPFAAAAPDGPAVAAPAEQVENALEHAAPDGAAIEIDSHDPQVLRVIIPDTVLNFESGRSELAHGTDRVLAALFPAYAALVCGDLRDQVAAVVIEGHTDDLGGDALNLRLSQERSLHVLVRGLEVINATMPTYYDCFSRLASASGRGKQDLVHDETGEPNRELSRRVVFKIILRSSAPRA